MTSTETFTYDVVFRVETASNNGPRGFGTDTIEWPHQLRRHEIGHLGHIVAQRARSSVGLVEVSRNSRPAINGPVLTIAEIARRMRES